MNDEKANNLKRIHSDDSEPEVPTKLNTFEYKYEQDVSNREQPEESDKVDISEGYKNKNRIVSHYNQLQEKGKYERTKSRIFYMRNFNNWIKSMLISDYVQRVKDCLKLGDPFRVLDVCCGKGGDLTKWEKAGITHIICTDIADVSIEQCKERYKNVTSRRNKRFNSFTAEFFVADSTLVRLRERYKDPSIKLNIVSCQFALHYCFESLTQADLMIRNVSECLQPGGFFIATIPNAYEIMRRQRMATSKRFGNDIYSIEFECDTERPPIFGAKYKFNLEGVVDCPEFLVHFPTLEKLCRNYGLQLIEKHTFAEFFDEKKKDGKFLLQRMNALEKFPQINGLNGRDDEYEHAKTYLGTKSMTVGTLSKSEWEAITLYMVCGFKKCKNTWDSEGKPVYTFDDK